MALAVDVADASVHICFRFRSVTTQLCGSWGRSPLCPQLQSRGVYFLNWWYAETRTVCRCSFLPDSSSRSALVRTKHLPCWVTTVPGVGKKPRLLPTLLPLLGAPGCSTPLGLFTASVSHHTASFLSLSLSPSPRGCLRSAPGLSTPAFILLGPFQPTVLLVMPA